MLSPELIQRWQEVVRIRVPLDQQQELHAFVVDLLSHLATGDPSSLSPGERNSLLLTYHRLTQELATAFGRLIPRETVTEAERRCRGVLNELEAVQARKETLRQLGEEEKRRAAQLEAERRETEAANQALLARRSELERVKEEQQALERIVAELACIRSQLRPEVLNPRLKQADALMGELGPLLERAAGQVRELARIRFADYALHYRCDQEICRRLAAAVPALAGNGSKPWKLAADAGGACAELERQLRELDDALGGVLNERDRPGTSG